MWGNGNSCVLVVGLQSDTAILEEYLVMLRGVKSVQTL